ncbi:MAG TPA: hypothetical protein VHD32_06210 [Candidatus Didemnitutus sp.]|nr:hypothetical protein [Candidatus Didemnitutus sp.]
MLCWGPKKWDPENSAHFSISDQDPSFVILGPRKSETEPLTIVSFAANLLNTGGRVAAKIQWKGYILPQTLSSAEAEAYKRFNFPFRTPASEARAGGKFSMISELTRPWDYRAASPAFYVLSVEYSDGPTERRIRQNIFFKWGDPIALTKDPKFEHMNAEEVDRVTDFLKKIGSPLLPEGEIDSRPGWLRWLTR